jgi:thymidine kinase
MFTMILGPMKSGKSGELVLRVSPYEHTNKAVLYVQSEANVRDQGIQSRLGMNATALAVRSLHDVDQSFDIIGIDEVHMFDVGNEQAIDTWLHQGKDIIASGLDLDYRGKMLPIIIRLLELKPDKIISKTSACDACKEPGAQFTQILNHGEPVLSGLPPVVPEDGTYDYQARCRDCFVKE